MSFPPESRYGYRPPATYSYTPPSPPPQPTRERKATGLPVVLALVAALVVGGASGGVAGFVAGRAADSSTGSGSSFLGTRLVPPAESEAPAGSLAELVERISPSVVAIYTETPRRDLLFRVVPDQGAGSGIVLDDDGHVLTNAHVVAGASSIEVRLSDGRRVPGDLVGSDEAGDLAVVRIDADDLSPARFGDSDRLRAGDRVIAIGNALALPGGPTVTEGIVSAVDRTIQEENEVVLENLIQTDAAINPGNSGGPLLDAAGNVVGVNTAIASEGQSIGFAIAIAPARDAIEQLIRTGRVIRPLLGVQLIDAAASPEPLPVDEGAVVARVEPGSPAQAAGVQEGDVIVEVQGTAVTDASTAKRAIGALRPGDRMQFTVVRGQERIRLTATLAER